MYLFGQCLKTAIQFALQRGMCTIVAHKQSQGINFAARSPFHYLAKTKHPAAKVWNLPGVTYNKHHKCVPAKLSSTKLFNFFYLCKFFLFLLKMFGLLLHQISVSLKLILLKGHYHQMTMIPGFRSQQNTNFLSMQSVFIITQSLFLRGNNGSYNFLRFVSRFYRDVNLAGMCNTTILVKQRNLCKSKR